MTTAQPPVYLTAAETCERLRIGRETLRALIKSGQLTAHKVSDGRTSPYRISAVDLADYIRRQTLVAAS